MHRLTGNPSLSENLTRGVPTQGFWEKPVIPVIPLTLDLEAIL